VHPTKMEVRFTNEQDVFRAVYYAINNALLNESLVKNIEIESKNNIFKYEINSKKDEYIQERIGNIKSGSQMSKPEKAESKITGCETAELKEAEINEGEPKAEEKRKSVSETIELKSAKIKETESIAKLKITEPEITETKITKHEAAEPEIIKPEIAEPEAAKHEIAESKREKNEITEPKAVKHGITETETVKNEIAGIEAAKPIKAKQKASGPLLKEEPQGVEDITLEAKEDIFTDYRIIGQVFSTYIILQKGENLVLIDQHAAHERIVFEELKEKYYKEENLAQYLLEPVVIELTSQEAEFINDKSEMLNKLGFITENFGDNSIILRSVPANSEGGSIREAFLDVLDFLMSENKKDNVYIAEEVLYKMACKGAVKANEKLGDIEIRNIIKKLSQLKNPYTCPHGRPTIIKITKYELEKMFKRIV